MRKLSTKEILLLIALIFIVSGAVYYNYFFRPYQDKMIDLEVNLTTSNQRLLTLQNEQQSIIRDKEKLNNELAGVEEEFFNIPKGIDEPYMLVFIEETFSGIASKPSVRFAPEVSINEYYQTSQILMSYFTTYPDLEIILDSFYNAPFRNRIIYLNVSFQEPELLLGPQLTTEDEVPTEQADEDYLYVEMTVDCFTIPGMVTETNYPFMIGPYNNVNPFEKQITQEEP